MAIFKKHKKQNFTSIDNEIFKNRNLSMKAKGLLCQMLSLPDDWEFSEKGLEELFTDGVYGIKTALKELELNNYLSRTRLRNEKGQVTNTQYDVYEEPNLDAKNLHRENLHRENLHRENLRREITHNKILNNKILNNKENNNINIITKEKNDRVSTGIDRGINSSLEGYQPEIKDNNINNNNINNKENNNINIITKEKKKKTIDIGNVTNFYNYISNNQDIEMYLEDKRLLREKIEEWFKYKDERKEIYQETSIKTLTNRIIARAQEYGYKSVIEIIDLSISSNWQGIVWDKLEKLKENKNEKENETIIRGRIYE